MAKDFLGVDKGIKHKQESAAISYNAANEGAIYNENNTKMHTQIAGADREILNDSQVQSMTNKHIDSDLNEIVNIVDADIKAAAGILESKLALDHSTASLYTAGNSTSTSLATHSGLTSGVHGTVGTVVGTTDSQVLSNKSIEASANTITNIADANISGSASIAYSKLNLSNSLVNADVNSAAAIAYAKLALSNSILNADVNSSAAIAYSKLNLATSIVNADVASTAAIAESKLALNYSTSSLSSSIASTTGTLNSHIASNTVHGTSSAVVGISDAQVLTNKDIDGGTAANNRRITVPKDTLSNLTSLTRKEGTLVYGSDSKKLYVDIGTALTPVGSGSPGDPGALNMIQASDLNTLSTDIPLSGQNAAFDGGGSIGGTLSLDSTAADIMFSGKVIKYTNGSANKQNDYFGWTYTLPQNLATNGGVTVAFEFFYKVSSLVLANDYRFAVKIVGGTQDGIIQYLNLDASQNMKMAQMLFNIPQDATSLKYGFQLTSNTANLSNLFCDRILLTAQAFGKANLYNTEGISYTGYISGTTSGVKFKTKDTARSNNSLVISDDNSGSFTKFTVLRPCITTVTASGYHASGNAYIELRHYDSSGSIIRFYPTQSSGSTYGTTSTEGIKSNTGDYFIVSTDAALVDGTYTNFSITAIAESPAILAAGYEKSESWSVSQVQSSLTDRSGELEFALGTATITKNGQASTSTVLTGNTSGLIYAQDDSGSTRTRFYAARNCQVNIVAQAVLTSSGDLMILYKNGTAIIYGGYTSGTSQTAAIVTSIYMNAGDYITFGPSGSVTNSTPVAIIQINAVDAKPYTTVALPAGKVNDFSAVIAASGSITSQGPTQFIQSINHSGNGIWAITFVPGFFSATPAITASDATGGAYIMSFGSISTSGVTMYSSARGTGTLTDTNFNILVSRQGSDASTGSVYVGNVTPEQVCRISDQKSSGTAGGTFTAGAWQTRTLNTIEGDTSFASLSSNQITLQPGTYVINASATAWRVDENKLKLYDITNSADKILGSNSISGSTDGTQVESSLAGKISITSSTIYELRHYCKTTQASNGFGTIMTIGVNELYAQVNIRKLS